MIPEYRHRDVLRVILSRAARSARQAAHFDLEAPKAPQRGEYWCHKHRRECRPVESAAGFLRRYSLDTLSRIEEFARVRDVEREATVLCGDAREVALGGPDHGTRAQTVWQVRLQLLDDDLPSGRYQARSLAEAVAGQ